MVGSSVAEGQHASQRRGWAYHLGIALQRQHPQCEFVNAAISGFDSLCMRRHLPFVIEQQQPTVVIIALSLANEGLIGTRDKALASFEANMRHMINHCHNQGIKVVFGLCWGLRYAWSSTG